MGVSGENESGERLLGMCVEQELIIGNSFFFFQEEMDKQVYMD